MKMKKGNLFFFLASLFLLSFFTANSAFGSELSVFSKTYIRETAKPYVVTDTFTVADPTAKFTLIVMNGKNGQNRVSSAIIRINGKQVLGPSDFNQQVDVLKKTLTLKSNNEIKVSCL
jgi:hypothetical protein